MLMTRELITASAFNSCSLLNCEGLASTPLQTFLVFALSKWSAKLLTHLAKKPNGASL